MPKGIRRIPTGVMTVSALLLAALPMPALAQVQYGPWQRTNDCKRASAPSGLFRGGVQLPQAGGGTQAMECKWERDVQDCPRVRDKLAHLIRCTTRRDKAGYSINPPS